VVAFLEIVPHIAKFLETDSRHQRNLKRIVLIGKRLIHVKLEKKTFKAYQGFQENYSLRTKKMDLFNPKFGVTGFICLNFSAKTYDFDEA